MPELFDFLKSVCHEKTNLMVEPGDDANYVPYIINSGLSYFGDCILHANEINKYHHLPKKMQYDYYRFALSKVKRYSKWNKKQKHDDYKLVQSVYHTNQKRTREILSMLTEAQLNEIRLFYGEQK